MAYIGQSTTEGTRRVYTYVATASQTTFNAVYGVGAVDVYQNGILLAPADYTASDGTTVVLGVGAAFQDEITIVCHNTFSVADTVSASQGGTFNQPVTIDGNGATVLTVDRAASDGTIIDVQKNGTTVGSIGSYFGDLFIASPSSTDAGLGLGASTIRPVTTTGAYRDAAIDLGSTTSRFKDLYLSGGVYLGGTVAANYLDDYEEGTFTPEWQSGTSLVYSNQLGVYTKTGNVVTYHLYLAISSGTISGNGIIGLPFTASSVAGLYAMTGGVWNNATANYQTGRTSLGAYPNVNTTVLSIEGWGSGVAPVGPIFSSTAAIYITGQYFTDA